MPRGNLVEVLGREVRQGSPGELMVERSPSRQRRPPCKTSKEMSDEAAEASALTYLLTETQATPVSQPAVLSTWWSSIVCWLVSELHFRCLVQTGLNVTRVRPDSTHGTLMNTISVNATGKN